MKAVVATAVLALGATAHPNIAPRDPTTITSLLSSVFDAMTNADNLILEYHGGPPIALHQAGEAVLQVLEGGIGVAESLEPLSPGDVAAISCLSDKVTAAGTKYLNDISAAVPIWAANGLCELAHKFTTAFGNISSEFFATMQCKYPPECQEAANQEIFGANALFAEVLCALSPPSCVNQIQLPPPFGHGQCGVPHGPPHGGPPGAAPGEPAAEPSSETSIAWGTQPGSPCHPTSAPACSPDTPPACGADTPPACAPTSAPACGPTTPACGPTTTSACGADTTPACGPTTTSACGPTTTPACGLPSGDGGHNGTDNSGGPSGSSESNSASESSSTTESSEHSSATSSSSHSGHSSHKEEAKPSAPAIPAHRGSAGRLSVSGSAIALIGAIAFML